MSTALAPTGTVTFLFTDIEGSTRLWDRHPDAMTEVLAIHDGLLDRITATHGGYVFSKAGDGWGISFASARSALDAALSIQQELHTTTWPDAVGEPMVRMGLHAGTADERGGDYFGSAVNRAARVSSAAAGGQIFVTDAVRTLVIDDVDRTWRFRDLGEHRLRDLVRAERIWQIDSEHAPAPLAVLSPASVGNLPKRRVHIVGRADDAASVSDQLESSNLVTLVGVGGVGKTTLATEVARQHASEFEGGAWFVDLTTAAEAEEITAAVVSALGVTQRAGMTAMESLSDVLVSARHLIVLDNAEQAIDVIADFTSAILDAVDDIGVIVTSREPLSISGEAVYHLSPLSVHGEGNLSPAAALFTDRVAIAAPDLDPSMMDSAVIERICERLDGLPLAIELAASHAQTMMPSEILAALDANAFTLRSDSRSTTARHRTLDDLVGWSYQLLDGGAQTVFRRLSVFRDGCTTEAAVAVCCDEDVDEIAVREALRILVRKSMVVTDRSSGSTRFGMLETLRVYSDHRLAEDPDREDVEKRHATWFASLAQASGAGMAGPDEAEHLVRLVSDLDNIRAACAWANAHERFDLVQEIGTCLPPLIISRMRPGMDDWAREGVAALPDSHVARIDFAYVIGYVALFNGDLTGAADAFGEVTNDIIDSERRAVTMQYFKLVSAFFRGDLELTLRDSEVLMNEAWAINEVRVAGAIGSDLALSLMYSGDKTEARRIANELAERADRSGNPSILGWSRYILGEIEADTDPARAMELLEESVEYAVSVDNEFLAGIALVALGSTAGRNDEIPTALDAMYRAIRWLWYGAGNRPQLWTAIRNLVEILHTLGHDEEALTLHAAVEADAAQAPRLFGPFGDQYLAIVGAVAGGLDPDTRHGATDRGANLGYAGAVELALEVIDRITAADQTIA
jgi:predicted ATPase/class 3 adenylate cyclase